MTAIATFVVLVGMLILFNRAFAWTRKAMANHRALWMSRGYVENDPAHRLRADKYRRIGMIVYLVSGIVLSLLLQTSPMASSTLLVVIVSSMFAVAPAGIAMVSMKAVKEVTEPYGEASLALRDRQFHRAPKPLVPQGEHGTAQLETPAQLGLLNPIGWMIPARGIVSQVTK